MQEAMMRKFLSDIARSDYQQQAMTTFMFKQMFKENPEIVEFETFFAFYLQTSISGISTKIKKPASATL